MRRATYLAIWVACAAFYTLTGTTEWCVAMWATLILFHVVILGERMRA